MPTVTSVKKNLPVSPLLVVAVLVLVSVAGASWVFEQLAEDAYAARKHTTTVRVETISLKTDVMELSRGLRGYVISGKDEWLEPYREARREARERVRKLKTLVADNPAQQRKLDAFDDHLEANLAFSAKALQVATDQGLEAARTLVAGGAGRAELVKMEALLDEMDAEETRLYKLRDDTAARNSTIATAITLLGSLFALTLVI